jgi:hypothetical protein
MKRLIEYNTAVATRQHMKSYRRASQPRACESSWHRDMSVIDRATAAMAMANRQAAADANTTSSKSSSATNHTMTRWVPAATMWQHRICDQREYDWFLNQHETLGRPYEDSMYQWLPAEFAIDDDGGVNITSPINGCDRLTFPLLYRDIAAIFARMLPMFERCLGMPLRNRNLQVYPMTHRYFLAASIIAYRSILSINQSICI